MSKVLSQKFSRTSYKSRTVTVNGKSVLAKADVVLKLSFSRLLGEGTFGFIEQATLAGTNECVAVKQVFQDPKYKNRELSILLSINDHPNIIRLLYYYYTSSSSSHTKNGVYLHLVMECFPESLSDLILRYNKQREKLSTFKICIYTFQMLRALGFIHLSNICHRDIKSSNLLVNEATSQVKLCDFGSAKELIPGQQNISYISSRYYRAPELIFGAEYYDCSIDIWSAGCVIAEMILLKCLFMGSDSFGQLAEIFKIIGTPTPEDLLAMNPSSQLHNFPKTLPSSLQVSLPNETSLDLVALLGRIFVYQPKKRISSLAALCHPFFADLINEIKSRKSKVDRESKKSPSISTDNIPADLLLFTRTELAAEHLLESISLGFYADNSDPSPKSNNTDKNDNSNSEYYSMIGNLKEMNLQNVGLHQNGEVAMNFSKEDSLDFHNDRPHLNVTRSISEQEHISSLSQINKNHPGDYKL